MVFGLVKLFSAGSNQKRRGLEGGGRLPFTSKTHIWGNGCIKERPLGAKDCLILLVSVTQHLYRVCMVAQHGMAVSAPKAAFGLAPAATVPRWQERTVSSKDGFRMPNVGHSLSAHPAVPSRARLSQEGGLCGLKATLPRSGNGGTGGRRWALQMMLGACIAFISVPFAPMAAFAKGGAGQEAASGGM